MSCLCMDLQETMYRLKAYGVKSTILFFGSARAKSRPQWEARLAEVTAQVRRVSPDKHSTGIPQDQPTTYQIPRRTWC
jgi:hypothetical protein